MKAKHWYAILVAFFFIGIFFFTSNNLSNIDIWFHIKSGEVIAQQGILFHDVFSEAAPNRGLYPYEWLFQLILFLFTQAFGVENIKYFIGFWATAQVAILFFFVRKFFRLSLISSFFIGALYAITCYSVFAARPALVTTAFLLASLFLLFLYLLRDKNLLWITLPIMYLWSNMHGSAILIIGFFALYATLAFCYSWYTKDKKFRKKSQILGIYSVLLALVSLLPPTGFVQYQFLWLIFTHKELINQIAEWQPLISFQAEFYLYLLPIICIALPISIYGWVKKKPLILWFLPFWVFIFFGFTALRQTLFGYFAIIMLIACFLSTLNFKRLHLLWRTLIPLAGLLLLIGTAWFFYERAQITIRQSYIPRREAAFIKQANIQGNMFNMFEDGGYLLYSLYPEKKIFIDGRVDPYICCELPDYFALQNKTPLPLEQFSPFAKAFIDKYHFNYAILSIDNYFPIKIAKTIQKDNWKLVYWNDKQAIYVRDDGINNDVIAKYGAFAATPFGKEPYLKGQRDKALAEYLRMDTITPSANAKSTIGFIYLQKGELANARKYLLDAIYISPDLTSAIANLAEVYLQQGNPAKAISIYSQLIIVAPTNLPYYYRLGTLYAAQGEPANAMQVFQRGLDLSKTLDDKERFQSALQKLQ